MKKILLVEDKEDFIDFYKMEFKNRAELVISRTYDEFLENLSVHKDTLFAILTDFYFPGGNGNDVARAASAAGINKVYLQSGAPEEADKKLFVKTFLKSEIKQAVEEILSFPK